MSCGKEFLLAVDQHAGDGVSPLVYRPPRGFRLQAPELEEQEKIVDGLRAWISARSAAETGVPPRSELSYLSKVVQHLVDWLEDERRKKQRKTAHTKKEEEGGGGGDESVSEGLYEVLSSLLEMEMKTAAAAAASSASSSVMSGVETLFPLLQYSVRPGFPSAEFEADAIFLRRSGVFSDISRRVWPATFSLVDSLAVLSADFKALLRHASSSSSSSSSHARSINWVELGSGAGLAGLALARMLSHESSPLHGCVRSLTLTDGCPAGVTLLEANVGMNNDSSSSSRLSPSSLFPVAAKLWAWGGVEVERTSQLHPSPLPAEGEEEGRRPLSALFGSDLIYEPAAVRLLVATLRQQLVPRKSGETPEVSPPSSWRESLAAAAKGDSSSSSSSRWPGFPWTTAEENRALSPPLFALIASTIRNEETYALFLDLLEKGRLRYFDITEEVRALLEEKGKQTRTGTTEVATSLPSASAAERLVAALPPSMQFSALRRYASLWEAFLVPDGGEDEKREDGGVGEAGKGTKNGGGAAAAVVMPVKICIILPPLAKTSKGDDDADAEDYELEG